jgi:hypothetical protein
LTVVVSDIWGYDASRAPYRDYGKFERSVRRMAEQSGERPVIFDIWNEPNARGQYWHGTPEQFLETFARAHDAIRSVRPRAVIAGPSLAFYKRDLYQRFLDFCLKHHLRLDVLTWHEFRTGDKIAEIADDLREARRDFIEDPKYRPLGIREIHINEAVAEEIQYKPASILAVLGALESGGADGAARACWNDSRGRTNCWNNTLDGLLVPGSYEPRAAWWTYKAYADGVDARVAAKVSGGARIVALATRRAHDGDRPQVLVGAYSGRRGGTPDRVELVLDHLDAAPGLRGAKELRVSVARIPDSGEAPVRSLPRARTIEIKVSGDSARGEIPLEPEEVLVLTLERG